MRQTVHAGKSLDFVTPDELEQRLGSLARRLRSDQRTMRPGAQGKTDSAGLLVLPVYECPVGLEFALHRLVIEADGFTPGVPFNAAAGYIDILRSDERCDFLSLAAGSGAIPAVFSAGTQDAIRFRNGEVVSVRIVGGPASNGIVVRGQGTLQPVTTE